jgi:hypothetical protein
MHVEACAQLSKSSRFVVHITEVSNGKVGCQHRDIEVDIVNAKEINRHLLDLATSRLRFKLSKELDRLTDLEICTIAMICLASESRYET